MKTLLLLCALVAADAGMWRYEDAAGNVNFTNNLDAVPLEFRAKATRFEPRSDRVQSEAALGAGGIAAYASQKELDEAAALTQAQAEERLRAGRLTEAQVRYLVERGVLRTSALGDTVRSGRTQAELAAERAQAAKAANEDPLGLGKLAVPMASPQGIRERLRPITESPKFRWSLIGEGVLMGILIVALPFALRKYHEDGTRRIVRLSFIFIFVIISATGNLVLFRDEIALLFGVAKDVQTAGAPQPPNPSGKNHER